MPKATDKTRLQLSRANRKPTNNERALRRACQFTARFWGDILRLNLFKTNMQSFAQGLATQTNPLDQITIDLFQRSLETYIYDELNWFDHSRANSDEMNFQRWVGCFSYGPNTYLAEVAESFSISSLYFPPQTGWYVNPGCVISLSGEIRRFNFSPESLN